ncbi:putative Dynein heavy chain, N-terminal region 2 [Blattamonas nauphoetae]|uniref:Dynein heavy chain, N-terminal region 2 n=1 Tax=Blattamonas nauphoetae TaxID=2049346 RepID=A0ABQ9YEH8_9EUKA|nr:putative Dynein heavy chain, N-terminal region 2 [Blattamonas nauphoetae]
MQFYQSFKDTISDFQLNFRDTSPQVSSLLFLDYLLTLVGGARSLFRRLTRQGHPPGAITRDSSIHDRSHFNERLVTSLRTIPSRIAVAKQFVLREIAQSLTTLLTKYQDAPIFGFHPFNSTLPHKPAPSLFLSFYEDCHIRTQSPLVQNELRQPTILIDLEFFAMHGELLSLHKHGYLRTVLDIGNLPPLITAQSLAFNETMLFQYHHLKGRRELVDSIHPNAIPSMIALIKLVDAAHAEALSRFTWNTPTPSEVARLHDQLVQVFDCLTNYIGISLDSIDARILQLGREPAFHFAHVSGHISLDHLDSVLENSLQTTFNQISKASVQIEKELHTLCEEIISGYINSEVIIQTHLQQYPEDSPFLLKEISPQRTNPLDDAPTFGYDPHFEIITAAELMLEEYQATVVKSLHRMTLLSLKLFKMSAMTERTYKIRMKNDHFKYIAENEDTLSEKQFGFSPVLMDVQYINDEFKLEPSFNSHQAILNKQIRNLFQYLQRFPKWDPNQFKHRLLVLMSQSPYPNSKILQSLDNSGSASIIAPIYPANTPMKDDLHEDSIWSELDASHAIIFETIVTSSIYIIIGDLSEPIRRRLEPIIHLAKSNKHVLSDIRESSKQEAFPRDFLHFCVPEYFIPVDVTNQDLALTEVLQKSLFSNKNKYLYSNNTIQAFLQKDALHVNIEAALQNSFTTLSSLTWSDTMSMEKESSTTASLSGQSGISGMSGNSGHSGSSGKSEFSLFSLSQDIHISKNALWQRQMRQKVRKRLSTDRKNNLNRAFIVHLIGFPPLTETPSFPVSAPQPWSPPHEYNPDPHPYHCELCKETMVSLVTLTNHINQVHRTLHPHDLFRVRAEARLEFCRRGMLRLEKWRAALEVAQKRLLRDLGEESHPTDIIIPKTAQQSTGAEEKLVNLLIEILTPVQITQSNRLSFSDSFLQAMFGQIEENKSDLTQIVEEDTQELLDMVYTSLHSFQNQLLIHFGMNTTQGNNTTSANLNRNANNLAKIESLSSGTHTIERFKQIIDIFEAFSEAIPHETYLTVAENQIQCLPSTSKLKDSFANTLSECKTLLASMLSLKLLFSRWSMEQNDSLASQLQKSKVSIQFEIQLYLNNLNQLDLEDDVNQFILALSVNQKHELTLNVASHLKEKQQRLDELNSEEVLFTLTETPNIELKAKINRVNYLQSLLGMYSEYLSWIEQLKQTRLLDAQLEMISSTRVQYNSRLRSVVEMLSVVPITQATPHPVQKRLENDLEQLKKSLFICDIDPRHMKRRHWAELAEITGHDCLARCLVDQPTNPKASPTFGELFEAGDSKFESECRQMSIRALHENKVETELGELRNKWEHQIVLTFAQASTFDNFLTTSLLDQTSFDAEKLFVQMAGESAFVTEESIKKAISEANQTLAALTALSYSKAITPFLDTLNAFQTNLQALPHSLALFLRSQTLWITLRNLFGSTSVSNELQTEHRTFVKVTEDWAHVISSIHSNPHPYHTFSPTEFISFILPRLSGQLESCRSSIISYLDRKADTYPILYLLPTDDLFTAIASSHTPQESLPILRKLFPSLRDLITDNDQVNFSSSGTAPLSRMDIIQMDMDSDSSWSVDDVPLNEGLSNNDNERSIQSSSSGGSNKSLDSLENSPKSSHHQALTNMRHRKNRHSISGSTPTSNIPTVRPIIRPPSPISIIPSTPFSAVNDQLAKASSPTKSISDMSAQPDRSRQSDTHSHSFKPVRILGFVGPLKETIKLNNPFTFEPSGEQIQFYMQVERALKNAVVVSMMESLIVGYPILSYFFNPDKSVERGEDPEEEDRWDDSMDSSETDTSTMISLHSTDYSEEELLLGQSSQNLSVFSTPITAPTRLNKDQILSYISPAHQQTIESEVPSSRHQDDNTIRSYAMSETLRKEKEKKRHLSHKKRNQSGQNTHTLSELLENLPPAYQLLQSKNPSVTDFLKFVDGNIEQSLSLTITTHIYKFMIQIIQNHQTAEATSEFNDFIQRYDNSYKTPIQQALSLQMDLTNLIASCQELLTGPLPLLQQTKLESALIALLGCYSTMLLLVKALRERDQTKISLIMFAIETLPQADVPLTSFNQTLIDTYLSKILPSVNRSSGGTLSQATESDQSESRFQLTFDTSHTSHSTPNYSAKHTAFLKIRFGQISLPYGGEYVPFSTHSVGSWGMIGSIGMAQTTSPVITQTQRMSWFMTCVARNVSTSLPPTFNAGMPVAKTQSLSTPVTSTICPFTIIQSESFSTIRDRTTEIATICGHQIVAIQMDKLINHPQGLIRFVTAIAGQGQWGMMDNLDDLDEPEMENIVTLLTNCVTAAKLGHTRARLSAGQICKITPGFHFFASISLTPTTFQLPEPLRREFRPFVVYKLPDEDILTAHLAVGGFKYSGLLASRTVSFLNHYKNITRQTSISMAGFVPTVSLQAKSYSQLVLDRYFRPLLSSLHTQQNEFRSELIEWLDTPDANLPLLKRGMTSETDDIVNQIQLESTDIPYFTKALHREKLAFLMESFALSLCLGEVIWRSFFVGDSIPAIQVFNHIFPEFPVSLAKSLFHAPPVLHTSGYTLDVDTPGREGYNVLYPEEAAFLSSLDDVTTGLVSFQIEAMAGNTEVQIKTQSLSKLSQNRPNSAAREKTNKLSRSKQFARKIRNTFQKNLTESTSLEQTDQSEIGNTSELDDDPSLQRYETARGETVQDGQNTRASQEIFQYLFQKSTTVEASSDLLSTVDAVSDARTQQENEVILSVQHLYRSLRNPLWLAPIQGERRMQPQPTLLVGPAGCGKTTIINLLAQAQTMSGIPTRVVRVNMSSISLDQIIGSFENDRNPADKKGSLTQPVLHPQIHFTGNDQTPDLKLVEPPSFNLNKAEDELNASWIDGILSTLLNESMISEKSPLDSDNLPPTLLSPQTSTQEEILLVIDLGPPVRAPPTSLSQYTADVSRGFYARKPISELSDSVVPLGFHFTKALGNIFRRSTRMEILIQSELLRRRSLMSSDNRSEEKREGIIIDDPYSSHLTTRQEVVELLLNTNKVRSPASTTVKQFMKRLHGLVPLYSTQMARRVFEQPSFHKHRSSSSLFSVAQLGRRRSFQARHTSKYSKKQRHKLFFSSQNKTESQTHEDFVKKKIHKLTKHGQFTSHKANMLETLSMTLLERKQQMMKAHLLTDTALMKELEKSNVISHSVRLPNMTLFSLPPNVKVIFEAASLDQLPFDFVQNLSVLSVPMKIFTSSRRFLFIKEIPIFPSPLMVTAEHIYTVLVQQYININPFMTDIWMTDSVLSAIHMYLTFTAGLMTVWLQEAGQFAKNYFNDICNSTSSPHSSTLRPNKRYAQQMAKSLSRSSAFFENTLHTYVNNTLTLYNAHMKHLMNMILTHIFREQSDPGDMKFDFIRPVVTNVVAYSVFWGVGGSAFSFDDFRDAFSEFMLKLIRSPPNLSIKLIEFSEPNATITRDIQNMSELRGIPSASKPNLADFLVNLSTGMWEPALKYYKPLFKNTSTSITPSVIIRQVGDSVDIQMPQSVSIDVIALDEFSNIAFPHECTLYHTAALYASMDYPSLFGVTESIHHNRVSSAVLRPPLSSLNPGDFSSNSCIYPVFQSVKPSVLSTGLNFITNHFNRHKTQDANTTLQSPSELFSNQPPTPNAQSSANIEKSKQSSSQTSAIALVFQMNPPISIQTLSFLATLVETGQFVDNGHLRQAKNEGISFAFTTPLGAALWLPPRFLRHFALLAMPRNNPTSACIAVSAYFKHLLAEHSISLNENVDPEAAYALNQDNLPSLIQSLGSVLTRTEFEFMKDQFNVEVPNQGQKSLFSAPLNDPQALISAILVRIPSMTVFLFHLIYFPLSEKDLPMHPLRQHLKNIFTELTIFPISLNHVFYVIHQLATGLETDFLTQESPAKLVLLWMKLCQSILFDRTLPRDSVSVGVLLSWFGQALLTGDEIDLHALQTLMAQCPFKCSDDIVGIIHSHYTHDRPQTRQSAQSKEILLQRLIGQTIDHYPSSLTDSINYTAHQFAARLQHFDGCVITYPHLVYTGFIDFISTTLKFDVIALDVGTTRQQFLRNLRTVVMNVILAPRPVIITLNISDMVSLNRVDNIFKSRTNFSAKRYGSTNTRSPFNLLMSSLNKGQQIGSEITTTFDESLKSDTPVMSISEPSDELTLDLVSSYLYILSVSTVSLLYLFSPKTMKTILSDAYSKGIKEAVSEEWLIAEFKRKHRFLFFISRFISKYDIDREPSVDFDLSRVNALFADNPIHPQSRDTDRLTKHPRFLFSELNQAVTTTLPLVHIRQIRETEDKAKRRLQAATVVGFDRSVLNGQNSTLLRLAEQEMKGQSSSILMDTYFIDENVFKTRQFTDQLFFEGEIVLPRPPPAPLAPCYTRWVHTANPNQIPLPIRSIPVQPVSPILPKSAHRVESRRAASDRSESGSVHDDITVAIPYTIVYPPKDAKEEGYAENHLGRKTSLIPARKKRAGSINVSNLLRRQSQPPHQTTSPFPSPPSQIKPHQSLKPSRPKYRLNEDRPTLDPYRASQIDRTFAASPKRSVTPKPFDKHNSSHSYGHSAASSFDSTSGKGTVLSYTQPTHVSTLLYLDRLLSFLLICGLTKDRPSIQYTPEPLGTIPEIEDDGARLQRYLQGIVSLSSYRTETPDTLFISALTSMYLVVRNNYPYFALTATLSHWATFRIAVMTPVYLCSLSQLFPTIHRNRMTALERRRDMLLSFFRTLIDLLTLTLPPSDLLQKMTSTRYSTSTAPSFCDLVQDARRTIDDIREQHAIVKKLMKRVSKRTEQCSQKRSTLIRMIHTEGNVSTAVTAQRVLDMPYRDVQQLKKNTVPCVNVRYLLDTLLIILRRPLIPTEILFVTKTFSYQHEKRLHSPTSVAPEKLGTEDPPENVSKGPSPMGTRPLPLNKSISPSANQTEMTGRTQKAHKYPVILASATHANKMLSNPDFRKMISTFDPLTLSDEQVELIQPYLDTHFDDPHFSASDRAKTEPLNQFIDSLLSYASVRKKLLPLKTSLKADVSGPLTTDIDQLKAATSRLDTLRVTLLAILHQINNIFPSSISSSRIAKPLIGGETLEGVYVMLDGCLSQLEEVEQNIINCRGDSALAAALVVFNGCLPPSEWNVVMQQWKKILKLCRINFYGFDEFDYDSLLYRQIPSSTDIEIVSNDPATKRSTKYRCLDISVDGIPYNDFLIDELARLYIPAELVSTWYVLHGPMHFYECQADGFGNNFLHMFFYPFLNTVDGTRPVIVLDPLGIGEEALLKYIRRDCSPMCVHILETDFFENAINAAASGVPLVITYVDVGATMGEPRAKNILDFLDSLCSISLNAPTQSLMLSGKEIRVKTGFQLFVIVKDGQALLPSPRSNLYSTAIPTNSRIINFNALHSEVSMKNQLKYNLFGPAIMPNEVLLRSGSFGRLFALKLILMENEKQMLDQQTKMHSQSIPKFFHSMKQLSDSIKQCLQSFKPEMDAIFETEAQLHKLNYLCDSVHCAICSMMVITNIRIMNLIEVLDITSMLTRPYFESGMPTTFQFQQFLHEALRRAITMNEIRKFEESTKSHISNTIRQHLEQEKDTKLHEIEENPYNKKEENAQRIGIDYLTPHDDTDLKRICDATFINVVYRLIIQLKRTVKKDNGYTSTLYAHLPFLFILAFQLDLVSIQRKSHGILTRDDHHIPIQIVSQVLGANQTIDIGFIYSPVIYRVGNTVFTSFASASPFEEDIQKGASPQMTGTLKFVTDCSELLFYPPRINFQEIGMNQEIEEQVFKELKLVQNIFDTWKALDNQSVEDSFRAEAYVEHKVEWNAWLTSLSPEKGPFPTGLNNPSMSLERLVIVFRFFPHQIASSILAILGQILNVNIPVIHPLDEMFSLAIDLSYASVPTLIAADPSCVDVMPYLEHTKMNTSLYIRDASNETGQIVQTAVVPFRLPSSLSLKQTPLTTLVSPLKFPFSSRWGPYSRTDLNRAVITNHLSYTVHPKASTVSILSNQSTIDFRFHEASRLPKHSRLFNGLLKLHDQPQTTLWTHIPEYAPMQQFLKTIFHSTYVTEFSSIPSMFIHQYHPFTTKQLHDSLIGHDIAITKPNENKHSPLTQRSDSVTSRSQLNTLVVSISPQMIAKWASFLQDPPRSSVPMHIRLQESDVMNVVSSRTLYTPGVNSLSFFDQDPRAVHMLVSHVHRPLLPASPILTNHIVICGVDKINNPLLTAPYVASIIHPDLDEMDCTFITTFQRTAAWLPPYADTLSRNNTIMSVMIFALTFVFAVARFRTRSARLARGLTGFNDTYISPLVSSDSTFLLAATQYSQTSFLLYLQKSTTLILETQSQNQLLFARITDSHNDEEALETIINHPSYGSILSSMCISLMSVFLDSSSNDSGIPAKEIEYIQQILVKVISPSSFLPSFNFYQPAVDFQPTEIHSRFKLPIAHRHSLTRRSLITFLATSDLREPSAALFKFHQSLLDRASLVTSATLMKCIQAAMPPTSEKSTDKVTSFSSAQRLVSHFISTTLTNLPPAFTDAEMALYLQDLHKSPTMLLEGAMLREVESFNLTTRVLSTSMNCYPLILSPFSPLQSSSCGSPTHHFSPLNHCDSSRLPFYMVASCAIPHYVSHGLPQALEWQILRKAFLSRFVERRGEKEILSFLPLGLLTSPETFISLFIIEADSLLASFHSQSTKSSSSAVNASTSMTSSDDELPSISETPNQQTKPTPIPSQQFGVVENAKALIMSFLREDPTKYESNKMFISEENNEMVLVMVGFRIVGVAWDFVEGKFVSLYTNGALPPNTTQTPIVKLKIKREPRYTLTELLREAQVEEFQNKSRRNSQVIRRQSTITKLDEYVQRSAFSPFCPPTDILNTQFFRLFVTSHLQLQRRLPIPSLPKQASSPTKARLPYNLFVSRGTSFNNLSVIKRDLTKKRHSFAVGTMKRRDIQIHDAPTPTPPRSSPPAKTAMLPSPVTPLVNVFYSSARISLFGQFYIEHEDFAELEELGCFIHLHFDPVLLKSLGI